MSRRFYDLLGRSMRVRRLIEEEQRRASPSTLKLVRLKGLSLRIRDRLNRAMGRRLVAIASAPRFRPALATVNGRRW